MTFLTFVLLAAAQDPAETITDLDLEDLMNVRVTSAARKAQPVSDVPAAVHVIRGEDLRRSGALTLPEALRGVPGVQVAQTKARQWAVTVRGFNDVLANKLLVLVDGRSVYSPLQSGVYWDVQDVLLEDVERIEVVRGPGGSVWGANAVNGVINVITKPAGETRGGVATAGGGSEERAFGSVRYGLRASEDLDLRVYAKHGDTDDFVDGLDDERDDHDDFFMTRGGFRADWKSGVKDRVILSGDAYRGQVQERVTQPLLPAAPGDPTFALFDQRTRLEGANALGRWESGTGLSAQAYYDYASREHALYEDVIHTWDLDVQHRFSPLAGHDLIWGAGYRVCRIEFDGSFAISIDPELRRDDVVSAFAQDEITIVETASA
jgi:iron complex outermembrane receptor protein